MILRALVIFTGISVIAVALIAVTMPIWQNDRPATCYPDDCFCEFIHEDTTFKQPVNAFSSLAYALVGVVWIAGSSERSRSGPFAQTAGLRVMFALSAITIGVGSAYYHASLTFSGQVLDVLGMYLLTTLMVVYAWQRLRWLNVGAMWGAYVALIVVLAVLLVALPELRRWLFALVLVIALVFEVAYLRTRTVDIDIRWLAAGLVLFGLAFVVWTLDNAHILCDPTSVLQGHGFWHILGAAATYCLFSYYASEAA